MRLAALKGVKDLVGFSQRKGWEITPEKQKDILRAVHKVAGDTDETERVREEAARVLKTCEEVFKTK